jgi:outer membrane protein assembly factor BamB
MSEPPLRWGHQQNVRWVCDLPGEGSATPIVWGNQVFILTAVATDRQVEKPNAQHQDAKTTPSKFIHQFQVLSIDRHTGKVQWERTAVEEAPHEGRHQTHTYAAGSPTTDGERLFASFGSRGIFCYSLTGDLIWETDLGDMRTRFGWGEAVTPVLAGDLLIVNWDQEEGSFITALDKRTGKAIWRVERLGEATSWNTPLVTEFEGRQFVVVNGSGRVQAYDAKDGNVVWTCRGQTVNAIPSPIRFENDVICMSGYRGAMACSMPLQGRGELSETKGFRWQFQSGTPYVPSPILVGERLIFTAGNSNVLTCLHARTGKPMIERRRLPEVNTLYASPLYANGHIFITSREGTTVVLKDNDALDVVAVNKLNDTIDASPVAVEKQLLLRSWKKLYAISASPN